MSRDHEISDVKSSPQNCFVLNKSVLREHKPCSKKFNGKSKAEKKLKGREKTGALSVRTEALFLKDDPKNLG